MDALIHTLYESDFYRILDFRCRCTECRTSRPEYSQAFSISFVRKGNFLFNVFRRSLDSYTGCVLVTKPGYERTVTHTHTVPDECTIFEFRDAFYCELQQRYGRASFFISGDQHSTLVRTTAETEFLHHYIVRQVMERKPTRLLIDSLVLDMARTILGSITDYEPDARIHMRLKRQHLSTIEAAKAYINDHFSDDLSVAELAAHCHVSPFHFSRIFRTFTDTSPYRFLQTVRLRNAALLLRSTALPVGDIAFSSGFNSIEHFSAAFSQEYDCAPMVYRRVNDEC